MAEGRRSRGPQVCYACTCNADVIYISRGGGAVCVCVCGGDRRRTGTTGTHKNSRSISPAKQMEDARPIPSTSAGIRLLSPDQDLCARSWSSRGVWAGIWRVAAGLVAVSGWVGVYGKFVEEEPGAGARGSPLPIVKTH